MLLLSCCFEQQKLKVVAKLAFKGQPPEVLFHRNTSSYSYFEFLRQFNKKQNMIKKNYQLNRNEKFVDKARQCFAFLHIKPKFKFAVQ